MRIVWVALLLSVPGCAEKPTPVLAVPSDRVAGPSTPAVGPVKYRSVRDAVTLSGSDLVAVGQARAPDELASSAWVARVTALGDVVWAWEGTGAWEMAERVAEDANGVVVVAGRSSPRDEADTVWVRAFESDGELLWTTTVAGGASIMALGSWGGTTVFVGADFGQLDMQQVELDDNGTILREQTYFVENPEAWFGNAYPMARRALSFVDGPIAEPGPDDEWELVYRDPEDRDDTDDARSGPAPYPPSLDVLASRFGPLDTPAHVYAEFRWWVEAGGPDDWPGDDAVVLATLDVLGAGGCESVLTDVGACDTALIQPSSSGDFSDPCRVDDVYANLVLDASASAVRRAGADLVGVVEDLDAENPIADAVFERAEDIGIGAVARAAFTNEALRERALELLASADPKLVREIELEARAASVACNAVASLRELQRGAGAPIAPFPATFDSACDQLFAVCADGQDGASMLPPKGGYRLRTSCAKHYPVRGDDFLDPCKAGVVRTAEVPEISTADAVARCEGTVITPLERDPRDCGVTSGHNAETVTFREITPGRFVIKEVHIDMQIDGP